MGDAVRMSETSSATGAPDAVEGQDAGDRQDAPGSDIGGALATGDGRSKDAVGGGARSGERREEPAGDVDPGADSLPDPEGYGPLSEGRDGQQFG